MHVRILGLIGVIGMWLAGGIAQAASLQVAPVLIDVAAPGAAAVVTVRNAAAKPLNVQIRVYKWLQRDGKDELVATADVVASPPAAALAPGGEQTVRIVRVLKTPAAREESYRLFVDEIPERTPATSANVNFVFRYSIPVFFGGSDRRGPILSWSVQRRAGALHITAGNGGDRRARIATLKVVSQSGQTLVSRDGLFGYVLGGSNASWIIQLPPQLPPKSLPPGSGVIITAQGDDGPIRGETVVRP